MELNRFNIVELAMDLMKFSQSLKFGIVSKGAGALDVELPKKKDRLALMAKVSTLKAELYDF